MQNKKINGLKLIFIQLKNTEVIYGGIETNIELPPANCVLIALSHYIATLTYSYGYQDLVRAALCLKKQSF